MRGQLSVDFFISLSLFTILVAYIVFQVLQAIPEFLRNIELQNLFAKAFSISEILVNDIGEPINWQNVDLKTIKRIGLMDETKNLTNLISTSKIKRVEEICILDYDLFRKLIGTNRTIFLLLNDLQNDKIVATCSPPIFPHARTRASISRKVVLFDGKIFSYGELTILIW